MSDTDIVVRVEGLSKIYRLGLKKKTYDSLAGMIIDFVRGPVKNFRKYRSLYRFDELEENDADARADIIWAVRDVSFDVRQGEVLGIIGRNGAGKSTLLKILTRITPPTRGRVEISGRVSSLLEVGTGFHRELTGRDNIFLNATILGMSKKEADRKFDEIVEFSGVERFLDTPVKRYSSGMAVRLAFAVAAHLEPEILIVDEVLAVGDSAFQKKCISKMQDVSKLGRTVLFVSHNMPAVNMLCSRAIHLEGGRIVNDGPTHDVVSAYLSSGSGISASREWTVLETSPGRDVVRLRAARIVSREGKTLPSVDIRKDVGLAMEYDVLKPGFKLLPNFWVYNEEGVVVFGTMDQDPEWRGHPRPEGRYTSTAWIPGNFLAEGMHFVSCGLSTRSPNSPQFYEPQLIAFNVTDNMGEGTARGDWSGDFGGVVRPLLQWETKYVTEG